MITLITGQPGAGKTIWALHACIKSARAENRPLYVYGVKNFQADHSDLADLSITIVEDDSDLSDIPDGSIVLVDEVQRVLRPRKFGDPITDWQTSLETHRHHALDYYFTTQDYRLLDVHARRLVGRYVHLRNLPGPRSNLLEFREVVDPAKDRRKAIGSEIFNYPLEIFNYYQSTVEVTDSHKRRRVGKKTYLVLLAVLLPFLVFAFLVSRLFAEGGFLNPSDQVSMDFGPVVGGSADPTTGHSSDPHVRFLPRSYDLPWTAPAYDDFFHQPASYPRPHCVILHHSVHTAEIADCRCFTQQVTPLPHISHRACVIYATHGVWDPARPDFVAEPLPESDNKL